tara:strand:+ start:259 stop:831 length:573 start_codon:yes stop_codon:yes gene_type:complete
MTRTLTIKKSKANPFSEGWHTATVSTAKYGDWNGTKFLDVCFDGYSENMNMRVYAKEGKNGEEFAIGNIFRFADAGITDGLEGADGNVTIKLDDSAEALVGKQINIFLYKDGDYSSVLPQIAPVPFKNIIEEFNSQDVDYWKSRAEKFFDQWIKPKLNTSATPTEAPAEASMDELISAAKDNKATEGMPF